MDNQLSKYNHIMYIFVNVHIVGNMAWVSPIGPYDLSANPTGLEQSWPWNLSIGGSMRSAVCHERIFAPGVGKIGPLTDLSPWPSWLPISMGNTARATFKICTHTYLLRLVRVY